MLLPPGARAGMASTRTTVTDTTTMDDTTPETLPPRHGPPGSPHRRSPRRFSTATDPRCCSVLAIVVIGSIVASADPASVLPHLARVGVRHDRHGCEAPADRVVIPDGEIGFVTVSHRLRTSRGGSGSGPSSTTIVIIRHEDEVNGDQTTEEKREQDQRRMQVSKNSAVVVALETARTRADHHPARYRGRRRSTTAPRPMELLGHR